VIGKIIAMIILLTIPITKENKLQNGRRIVCNLWTTNKTTRNKTCQGRVIRNITIQLLKWRNT